MCFNPLVLENLPKVERGLSFIHVRWEEVRIKVVSRFAVALVNVLVMIKIELEDPVLTNQELVPV